MSMSFTVAPWLSASAAAVIGGLGIVHLLFIFRGRKLLPREAALQAQMQAVCPRLTRKTTMWRAWIGFNASHSLGALLFAAVYAYLAFFAPELLFGDWFLAALGQVVLLAYLWLGWRYWFSAPTQGILIANVLFAAGSVAARL